MEQAFHFVLSLGATVLSPALVLAGIALRRGTRRISKDGVPVIGTVVEVRPAVDNDVLVQVEYRLGNMAYRCQFTNFKAQVGDTVELLVDPKAHDRAFIKSTMAGRARGFGCLAVFGFLLFPIGVVGLVVFFTVVRPGW